MRCILFPLTIKYIPQNYQNLLLEERKFFHDFWNPNLPLNPKLPHQKEIQDHFSWKVERLSFAVEGTPFEVEYSLIEPKDLGGILPKNFIYAPGNVVTHDNFILGLYPFLASYLEKRKREPGLIPSRFFILSQYDTYREDGKKFCPKNIHEPGLVFAQILKALTQQKGPIDLITAHSLGTIVLASSLKYLASLSSSKKESILPKNIYMDRGVSSTEKAGSLLGPLNPFLAFLSRMSDWNLDIGNEIYQHLSSRKDQALLLSEVKKDFYFSKDRSLVQSPYIQALTKERKAFTFSFDFPAQQYHPIAHHMLNNSYLEHYQLVQKEDSLLQEGESMADLAIRILYRENSNPEL